MPSPSLSIAPPSSAKSIGWRELLTKVPASCRRSTSRSSWLASNLPPQPVKRKSSRRKPPSRRSVIGPESRSQVSSYGTSTKRTLRHVDARRGQARARIRFHVVVGHADEARLEAGDRRDQRDVGLFDLAQAIGPVGVGVRPRDQDRGLGFPLRGEAQYRFVHGLSEWGASGRLPRHWPCWRPRRSPCSSRSTR